MSWSRGYVAESPYVTSYHAHQSPTYLAMACAVQGVLWEPGRKLAVADLGCGRGLTACALAASNPAWTVVGLDYMPAHVAEARSLAAEAGLSNVAFQECDLAEMTEPELDALPEFDVVTLHGLWSWVSDEVRAGVLRLLRRRLRAGGIVHVSFNALPGWAGGMGLQHLIRTVAATQPGPAEDRAAIALELAAELGRTGARLLDNSVAKKFLDNQETFDPAYLAHEFLNAHWRPAFFSDVAESLGAAKLEHVGSVRLRDNFDALVLSPAQREIQLSLPPGPARELIKDMSIVRTFRDDLFMRGIVAADRERLCASVTVALVAHLAPDHPKADPKVESAEGEMGLPEEVVRPMLAALRERPHRIGELLAQPTARRTNAAELLMILTHDGLAQPVWNPGAPGDPGAPGAPGALGALGAPDVEAVAAAARFNDACARRYATNGLGRGRYALASPVLGAGLGCGPLELAVTARLRAGDAPDADALATALVPAEATGEERAEAARTIDRLLRERLETFRQLGIV